MATVIAGFFDQESKSLIDQIKQAINVDVNNICLRYIDDLRLTDITNERLILATRELKKEKISVLEVDPLIKSYNINDQEAHENAIAEFKRALIVTSKLECPYIYLKLPIFDNVISQIDLIVTKLKVFTTLASKAKVRIILKQADKHQSNVYTYIIKKLKKDDLTVSFNPTYLFNNDESTTTAYRNLKDHMSSITVSDVDVKNNPKMIGYGKTNIISIFKKMIRDNYDGNVVLDSNLYPILSNQEDIMTKKPNFLQRVLKLEPRSSNEYSDLINKLGFEEGNKISFSDVLDNQIKALKAVFK